MKKLKEKLKEKFKEKDLVSFGNYVLDNARKNLDGVTDATLQNWKHDRKSLLGKLTKTFNVANLFPSLSQECIAVIENATAESTEQDPITSFYGFTILTPFGDETPSPGDICIFISEDCRSGITGVFSHFKRVPYSVKRVYLKENDTTEYVAAKILVKSKSEEPKPGDVCKFWDDVRFKFVIGVLDGIDHDEARFPYRTIEAVYTNCEKVTDPNIIKFFKNNGK